MGTGGLKNGVEPKPGLRKKGRHDGVAPLFICTVEVPGPLVPLHRHSFGVLQGEPKLLGQRLDRRPMPFPGVLGLKPEVPDPSAPGGDHPTDGAEVRAVDMLLVETADDVGRDTDEGAEGRRGLD